MIFKRNPIGIRKMLSGVDAYKSTFVAPAPANTPSSLPGYKYLTNTNDYGVGYDILKGQLITGKLRSKITGKYHHNTSHTQPQSQ